VEYRGTPAISAFAAEALAIPHSANEHQESGLVAHDGDVPLAGRGVF
jgi:hypothetical protein